MSSPRNFMRAAEAARLTESGRRLASQRDDLIAQGVDPAELAIPIAPAVPEDDGPPLTADDFGNIVHGVLTSHRQIDLVADPDDPWKLTRIYKCKGCGDLIDLTSAPKQFGSVEWCLHAHQARKIVEALAEL